MQKLNSKVTNEMDFFQSVNPLELISEYGSPLYVYNERILRTRCREMKNLVNYKNFKVNYSAKANCNLAFLQIIKDEGIDVDAMSIGEMFFEEKAGFKPENILFISNNVSEDEMLYAINKGINISVDSISQLKQYGRINPRGNVAIRFNPGVGTGHNKKVVTGGEDTKFGVNAEYIPEVKKILAEYNLNLIGINQHIGSLFMEDSPYISGVCSLLEIAQHFDNLEFIDIGGGFGIPYKKQKNEQRLNLKKLGEELDMLINDFSKSYGKEITFKIEPGRYISAECGILLGTVNAVKYNGNKKYIGTDIGMNVLARPVIYNSFHEVEIYRNSDRKSENKEKVSIVGNICESGDILANNELLPEIFEKDIIGVLDAGAYGHIMSSNYNNRLRPAEIMIRENNQINLIRKRDTLEDLIKQYNILYV